MLATEYARYYHLPPQGENESDMAFRTRVSGTLRGQGKIIEAHEVYLDVSYKHSSDVMARILGATAQTMRPRGDYDVNPAHKVDDDLAVGMIAQAPEPDPMNPAMAMMAMMMFGDK